MKKELSQEKLKSFLSYDPITGQFTRLKDTTQTKAGDRAGYVKSNGYREVYLDGSLYYEHRLAFFYMTGSFPENQVDHINHGKADNRWCNLRPATASENNRNTGIRKDNTSGVTGVSWCSGKQKWMVSCFVDGKTKYFGYFTEKEDAVKEATRARQHYYGAFATTSSNLTTEQVT